MVCKSRRRRNQPGRTLTLYPSDRQKSRMAASDPKRRFGLGNYVQGTRSILLVYIPKTVTLSGKLYLYKNSTNLGLVVKVEETITFTKLLNRHFGSLIKLSTPKTVTMTEKLNLYKNSTNLGLVVKVEETITFTKLLNQHFGSLIKLSLLQSS